MNVPLRKSGLLIAAGALVAAALVFGETALAQEPHTPTELWEQYPLDPEPSQPDDEAPQARGQRDDGAPAVGGEGDAAATDEEPFPILQLVVALSLILLGAALALGVFTRRLQVPERLSERLGATRLASSRYSLRSVAASRTPPGARLPHGPRARPGPARSAAVAEARTEFAGEPAKLPKPMTAHEKPSLRTAPPAKPAGAGKPWAAVSAPKPARPAKPKPPPAKPAGAGKPSAAVRAPKPARPAKPKPPPAKPAGAGKPSAAVSAPKPAKPAKPKPPPAKPAGAGKPSAAVSAPKPARPAKSAPQEMPRVTRLPRTRERSPGARTRLRSVREQSRPHAAVAPARKKLQCSIFGWRDGQIADFYAVAWGLQGHNWVVERSPRFEWVAGETPPAAYQAHAVLVAALRRSGWRPVGDEGAWYRQRFEREIDPPGGLER
jgi:hypothetical protein